MNPCTVCLFVTGPNGERLKCCSISFNEFHEECFPIGVTDNNFKHEKKCQEYVRSATAPRIGCTLGKLKAKASIYSSVSSSCLFLSLARDKLPLSSFASAKLNARQTLKAQTWILCRPQGAAEQSDVLPWRLCCVWKFVRGGQISQDRLQGPTAYFCHQQRQTLAAARRGIARLQKS